MLNTIAYKHHILNGNVFEKLLMPFYCFKIPYEIIDSVGYFDEDFNNGGEDVDYRIRTIQSGFDVKYCSAFALHFNGKSSWNGVETSQETQNRNEKYISYFREKWGEDLFNLCVVLGNPMSVIEKYNLFEYIKTSRFNDMIFDVINRR